MKPLLLVVLVVAAACSNTTAIPPTATLTSTATLTASPRPSRTALPPAATETLTPTSTALPPTATGTNSATPAPTATRSPSATPHPALVRQIAVTQGPTDLVFTATGEHVLAVRNQEFSLFNVEEAAQVWSLTAPGRILDYALSPEASYLALALDNAGSVDLAFYELTTGNPVRTLTGVHPAAIMSLEFSPDGLSLYAAAMDGRVKMWRLPDLQPGWTITAHQAEVLCLAISPNGQHFMTGSWVADQKILIWSVDGSLVSTVTTTNSHCYGAAFSPDGRWLLTRTRQELFMYETQTWTRAWRQAVDYAAFPMAGFSPDNRLYLGNQPGALSLIEPATQSVVWEFDIGRNTVFRFSPDGALLTAGRATRTIDLLNTGLAPVALPPLPLPITISPS